MFVICRTDIIMIYAVRIKSIKSYYYYYYYIVIGVKFPSAARGRRPRPDGVGKTGVT